MTKLMDEILKRTGKKLIQSQINTINDFDSEMKINGLKASSRDCQIKVIMQLGEKINKDFKEMTKEDIKQYFDSFNNKPYTTHNKKIILRKFFKWLYHGKYPSCVEWLKLSRNYYEKKQASDMLTEDEVESLVDACPDIQHKCLIKLLYDTAIRIGELCSLNISDVFNNGSNYSIEVTGKTGTRTVGLITSAPLMNLWLDLHPQKDNPDAPLFLSMSHRYYGNRLTTSGTYQILSYYKTKTKISKKVSPHILRHSKLTSLAKLGMVESELRLFAGWSNDSTMPSVYLHLTDDDVNQKRRQIETGEVPEKKKVKSILMPLICPRCGKQNAKVVEK